MAERTFPLAPMSPLFAWMTYALFGLPVALLSAPLVTGEYVLAAPGLLVIGIYAWIWLWFRPTRFEVSSAGVDVVWRLRRERIPREAIVATRPIDRAALRQEAGWGMRVGAGGVWGAFGWLWTTKRGIVRMYISRLDGLVWMETTDRPWLVTPAQPDLFRVALSQAASRIPPIPAPPPHPLSGPTRP
jgi:hypothetical protein